MDNQDEVPTQPESNEPKVETPETTTATPPADDFKVAHTTEVPATPGVDVPPSVTQPTTPQMGGGMAKKGMAMKLIVVLVVFFIAAAAAAFFFTSSSDDPVEDLLSGSSLREYNSVEHSFKVNFPGFPALESDTLDVEEFKVPFTSYSQIETNGERGYAMAVADYSVFNAEFTEEVTNNSLEGSINGAVQNTPGAVLVTADFATHKGNPAIVGHYTVPVDGEVMQAYMLVVLYNEKSFSLITIGESKEAFDDFSGSFTFTDTAE